MKKIPFLIILSFSLLSIPRVSSQNKNEGNDSQSFEDFRSEIFKEFNDFRNSVLDNYADFLGGVWSEYESFKGLTRDNTPKPTVPPVVEYPEEDNVNPDNQNEKPEKEIPDITENPPQTSPEPKPEIHPNVKPEPKLPDLTGEEPKPDSNHKGGFNFAFYEIPLSINDIDFSIADNLSSTSDFSQNWKNLDNQKINSKLVPILKKEIKKLGLNDYLAYKYIESYVNSKFKGSKDSSRMALLHYLLANLGYNARIAVSTKGTPMLLLPFKQIVYGRSYLVINNDRYYLFPPEGYGNGSTLSEKIMTCQLPSDVDPGSNFDLVIGELSLPFKPHHFELEYGQLHLSGEINEYLIPVLYRYPQMPIEDYAKSNLQPGLRKDLSEQIRVQLGGLTPDDAVEKLLSFTQNVFQYATDDNYHGFEKPYFIEETLFYPKNDCEDRAIFYTYFLHNALGRDTQLVSFPGHEAATVVLEQPKNGVFYRFNGKNYYISDPTYVGATTGMVMPSYSNIVPEVDYTY